MIPQEKDKRRAESRWKENTEREGANEMRRRKGQAKKQKRKGKKEKGTEKSGKGRRETDGQVLWGREDKKEQQRCEGKKGKRP